MSSAIEITVRRHRSNELLSAPTLFPVQRNAKDLSADQPTGELPQEVINSVVSALQEGQTHYVDVPGIAPLREALARFLASNGARGLGPAQVMVTAGVQESRFLSLQVIGAALGAVAIPEVVHPGVRQALGVRARDVRFLSIDVNAGMLPSVEAIRDALNGGCRFVYLESPSRLTGAFYNETTVQDIETLLDEFDAYVIWDQGLMPWTMDGTTRAPSRATLIGEAFPGVGLEGWALGYLATNDAWLSELVKCKQIMAICTSTPSQLAALKVSEMYETLRTRLLERLAEVRQKAIKTAAGLGLEVLDGGAVNLLAVKRPEGHVEGALEGLGYRYASGSTFGFSNILRLSVTIDNAVVEALAELAAALKS